MLRIIHSVNELRFGDMVHVYRQSINQSGRLHYPYLSDIQQKIQAENDLLNYVADMLKADRQSFCAAWELDGRYTAMLRMEHYEDGLLLTSLETAPEDRGKGYATLLVSAVLEYLGDRKVYAHIYKRNKASLAVHQKCGFRKVLDYALYLDGSVMTGDATYLFDPGFSDQ